MNVGLSKICSLHTYVVHRMFYFERYCKSVKKSGSPIRTAISLMTSVIASARTGSPLADKVSKGLRNGMIWSLEMAWSNRGAPVKDWRPAPIVESNEPTSTTLGCGQATFPTTKDPPIDSPNLKEIKGFSQSEGLIWIQSLFKLGRFLTLAL